MVEIIALLMFVGEPQKLTEMMYMPSVKKCNGIDAKNKTENKSSRS